MEAEVSLKPLVNPWHKVCCQWYFLPFAKGEPRGALALRGNVVSVRRDLAGAGEVVVQMGLGAGDRRVASHSAARKAEGRCWFLCLTDRGHRAVPPICAGPHV